MLSKIFPFVFLTGSTLYTFVLNIEFNSEMEKSGVVPDVIDEAPKDVCEVLFSGGVKANQGNTLTPTHVKESPLVKWNAEQGVFYLVCMTDPDAPSRKEPKFREWHHWLVGNVPDCSVDKGDVLTAYVGAGPPKGTGLHRYVILVYKQDGKIDFSEQRLPNNSGKGRGKFSIKKFAKKYKLGNPISGNFYQAAWDDYVPILYKQLEG